MIKRDTELAMILLRWSTAAAVGCLLLCEALTAQDPQNHPISPLPQAPVPANVFLQNRPFPFQPDNASPPKLETSSSDPVLKYSKSPVSCEGPCRITLEEAQAQARTVDNPMAHLAELQVEAARQARLALQSDYFPKISSTFANLHFNKFLGDQFEVRRPLLAASTTFAIPLFGQNMTLVTVTAAQPVTPIFKIFQVVNIARADERIAMAKAGMSVPEIARNVEKNYYDLLVAQRQLAIVRANHKSIGGPQLLASSAVMPGQFLARDDGQVESDKSLVIAASKVKELTASLDQLLGYPVDTELELIPPETQYEDISLKEAGARAMLANPEVIEAEQTVVKARAASTLSKLDYVPDIALLGGYAYQNNVIPVLPPDFSFVGVMATYTVFDFGKREHTVKERKAQLSAAELAVELTKAKVTASVKSSYYAMERARQLSELAHRMASAVQLRTTSYDLENAEIALTKAKLEVEMFQADLEYRQALAGLKALMHER